jgi:hypothetical protein
VPNYQTTSTELFKRAGKQFKRKHPGKHEERLVCRLETVTTVPHEDPVRGRDRVRGICAACKYLAFSWPACVPASAGVTLVTAPTSRIARIMRPVLGDACWAAVMAHANAWLQCAVSGESPARPGLYPTEIYYVTTGKCGVWKVLQREGTGRHAEASESTRVKRAWDTRERAVTFALTFRAFTANVQKMASGLPRGRPDAAALASRLLCRA